MDVEHEKDDYPKHFVKRDGEELIVKSGTGWGFLANLFFFNIKVVWLFIRKLKNCAL